MQVGGPAAGAAADGAGTRACGLPALRDDPVGRHLKRPDETLDLTATTPKAHDH